MDNGFLHLKFNHLSVLTRMIINNDFNWLSMLLSLLWINNMSTCNYNQWGYESTNTCFYIQLCVLGAWKWLNWFRIFCLNSNDTIIGIWWRFLNWVSHVISLMLSLFSHYFIIWIVLIYIRSWSILCLLIEYLFFFNCGGLFTNLFV